MNQHKIIRNVANDEENLLSFKKRERCYDVEVVINEERMPMHSIVLSGNSRYFEVNLLHTPKVPSVIILENVNAEATKAILNYCYEGMMQLNQKDALGVLEVAHFLMVKSVIDGCSKIIQATLDSTNCFDVWKLAQKLQLVELEQKAFEYVGKSLEEQEAMIKFNILTLNLSDFIKILKFKEDALSLIKEWINHDQKNRSKDLMSLLAFIELEKFSIETLVSISQDLCLSKECLSLFMNAISKKVRTDSVVSDQKRQGLFVIGGWNANQYNIIETFDFKSNTSTWGKRTEKFSEGFFSTTYHDKKIFMIGGSVKNTVGCYDINSRSITSLAPMHEARCHFSATVVDEYIYAFGGYGKSGSMALAERYDIKKNTWSKIKPMLKPRHFYGVAVIDKDIFIIGGLDLSVGDSSNECYSVLTEKWKTCSPMQEKRHSPGVAAINGLIYVVGGNNRHGDLSTMERYDPKADKWTYCKAISSPRRAISAVNVNNRLIVSGGFVKGSNYVSTVEQYDVKEDQWSSLPSLNIPRAYHNMISVPQDLL